MEKLAVRVAATCICVRRVAMPRQEVLTREEAYAGGDWRAEKEKGSFDDRATLLFGPNKDEVRFSGEWEVLMGQNEVVNWLRSTPKQLAPMRYAGEWKFAGDAVEPGEATDQTALRELCEEFELDRQQLATMLPCLRLLGIRQTRPVQFRSYIMHNYVAMASENQWLRDFDIEACNAQLARKRTQHADLVQSGAFWELSRAEKEAVAPEVHRVRWMGIREAIQLLFPSMNTELVHCDLFQRDEMERVGLIRRDPMFLTMALLLDLESFPSETSLIDFCDTLDPCKELSRVQWLWEGMPQHEIDAALAERRRLESSPGDPAARRFSHGAERITAATLENRRQNRLQADAIRDNVRSDKARL